MEPRMKISCMGLNTVASTGKKYSCGYAPWVFSMSTRDFDRNMIWRRDRSAIPVYECVPYFEAIRVSRELASELGILYLGPSDDYYPSAAHLSVVTQDHIDLLVQHGGKDVGVAISELIVLLSIRGAVDG